MLRVHGKISNVWIYLYFRLQ
uniref:Uncharacterized protein n=1 Tax=Lepeophtheirus salmonis TaxID=72036 RepID=A0A0K2UJC8_LEPSM